MQKTKKPHKADLLFVAIKKAGDAPLITETKDSITMRECTLWITLHGASR